MELRKNLELVDVQYENDNKKAVLTFLDKERKEIREVNFNKQVYKDGKYVDDPEKVAKVDEWCKTYFDTTFDKLIDLKEAGVKKDVYVYDRFNSLWESTQIEKPTEDMEGQIFQTEIKEIIVDDYFIRIHFDIDGKTYESKMAYGKYMEATKEWFVDPNKKDKQYAKFAEKFGVPVEKADTLVGHTLMVECKKAMGKYLYFDCKKFPQKKG